MQLLWRFTGANYESGRPGLEPASSEEESRAEDRAADRDSALWQRFEDKRCAGRGVQGREWVKAGGHTGDAGGRGSEAAPVVSGQVLWVQGNACWVARVHHVCHGTAHPPPQPWQ